MISESTVRDYAESQIGPYRWGYAETLDLNGVDYPIEWVETILGEEGMWAAQTKAVFKINLDGEDRYFAKEGYYRSHDGEYWDGAFYECRPVEVTVSKYERI